MTDERPPRGGTMNTDTPAWPPTTGDEVLGRRVTGDPGPTYVLSEPESTENGGVVKTVTHHRLAAVGTGATAGEIENPVETAREAIETGTLSPETTRVENLKPYACPRCERCQKAHAVDRPVACSFEHGTREVWLCRYCVGFYDGLTAGLDTAGGELTERDLDLAGDGSGGGE